MQDEIPHDDEGNVESPVPPEFSEDRIALRFSEAYCDDLRYVAQWKRWLIWAKTHWRYDETLRAFDLARSVCREASAEALETGGRKAEGIASSVASAKTVAAVLRLAGADRCHAAGPEEWDADNWALNTPGGSVDLRTGIVHPSRREDLCTRITAVAPSPPNAPAPRWSKFLQQVTNGDADLMLYLRQIAGYSLTGSTREHAMFFLYGPGGNGKGVLLNTLTKIAGSYATVAPSETWTESKHDRHPTELALLRGARLVVSQEIEQGRRWAEAKIKSLTGGDPITARFMRGDFFTFTPSFKLLIAGNHKPGLRGVDEAIRRRMILVPFTVNIPEEDRDDELAEKLKDEWPAILRWAIDGAVDWQREGLIRPSCVVSATEAYLASEDSMATWFEECCAADPQNTVELVDLFKSWRSWAERAGEFVASQKRLAEWLDQLGFPRWKSPRSRRAGFQGLRLVIASPTADPSQADS